MLYYSFLEQENTGDELWFWRDTEAWPVFDYKIDGDKIRLISDCNVNIVEAVTLRELIEYVTGEGNARLVPYIIVDEQTGKELDIKDRFENKLIFKICN